MAFFESSTDYSFTSEAVYSLSEGEHRYHQCHYKTGQKNFSTWIARTQGHTKQVINQELVLKMATTFVRGSGKLSEEALYDLQRWLRGRQVCFCHHLRKGDADDEHLHPIEIALQLIRMLRPENSDEIIAKCTPSNLRTLVSLKGSEQAKELYAGSKSSLRVSAEQEHTIEEEREQKHRRMSQESWRSSPAASGDETRSRRSSASSVSSRWSSGSWRTRTPSPHLQEKRSNDLLLRNWRSP